MCALNKKHIIKADRAKQIKTKASINEDPTEKLIRNLREENARLKKMLEGGNIDPNMLTAINESGADKSEINGILQFDIDSQLK